MDYGDMTQDAAASAPAQWHSKETAPTDGKWCWVSDGERVWLVAGHEDGTLRSDRASSVKFWTRDYIPEPPRTARAQISEIPTETNVNEH